jgi:hypothetical protein
MKPAGGQESNRMRSAILITTQGEAIPRFEDLLPHSNRALSASIGLSVSFGIAHGLTKQAKP